MKGGSSLVRVIYFQSDEMRIILQIVQIKEEDQNGGEKWILNPTSSMPGTSL